jgi:multidrug efflux pump
MAEQVTDKLERKLQETPYVDKIRSFSKPGETLTILRAARIDAAEGDHRRPGTRCARRSATSPPRCRRACIGPFFNDEFGDTYGSIFALSGDGFTYAEMKDYADFVRQQLLACRWWPRSSSSACRTRKINILFSHKKFAQLGVPFEAIVNQIATQNGVESAGVLVTPTDNLQVRVTGALRTVKELEDLQPARRHHHPPRRLRHRAARIPGPAAGQDALQRQGSDRPGRVDGKGRQYHPAGQRAGPSGRAHPRPAAGRHRAGTRVEPAGAVTASVNEFMHTLIEAVVIVLAVSFVALGLHSKPLRLDVRPGLVVALTIPLVLAITFLFMRISTSRCTRSRSAR